MKLSPQPLPISASLIFSFTLAFIIVVAFIVLVVGQDARIGDPETLSVGFGGLIIGWAFLFFSLRGLTRSVGLVSKTLEEMKGGNFDLELDPSAMYGEEFVKLANTFNATIVSLREVKERERAVSAAKSELLSLAAHQLRTPLSAIKWVFTMLLEGDAGKVTKPQREILEKGYASSERIIQLVSDFLNVVQIEEGRFGYNFGFYSIVDLAEEAITGFEAAAAKKHITLHLEKPRHPLPLVWVDEARMRLVLENLLSNAIRYTPEGGKVEMTLAKKEGFVKVAVKDNGVGIPKDEQSKIFTKFFRGRNAVTMETEGSGLGLYISKNIIEKHEGKMWFESEEGKGSTFYFTLPVKKTAPVPEEKFEEFVKEL